MSPPAHCPSSGFDGVNKEANVRANAAVVDGHANVERQVNDDDADNGIFDSTLCKILGTSSRVATSFDLDFAFGTIDVNVDLACT